MDARHEAEFDSELDRLVEGVGLEILKTATAVSFYQKAGDKEGEQAIFLTDLASVIAGGLRIGQEKIGKALAEGTILREQLLAESNTKQEGN